MNLVDGATTFPVLVGNDVSLARSKDAVHHMEAVGRGDLAVVVASTGGKGAWKPTKTS